ncbi:ATP-binding protein [Shinella sp.]|uniref:AAA family ATPase n=1 Tax=Shinella sp. TaxID=1870904 RepID=UPI002898F765|nr:ATP-binding protein [Shinella sp.]
MDLEKLGLSHGEERVAILVGPNGSGKSNLLKSIANEARQYRDVVVVSNTTHDRFAGMRGIDRLSAGRGGQSPKSIIKTSVARTIDDGSSLFYQIGSILEYCGYAPRFGFRVYPRWLRPLGQEKDLPADSAELQIALAFLERYPSREIIWIDQFGSHLDFSLGREFAAVLRNEEKLVRTRMISKPTEVFLDKKGEIMELKNASSGELALISSLVFLITSNRLKPLVLIDEPENSLHPVWQRDYISRVLTALEYRNASIVVATHAPLIVTGALASFKNIVSVFQMRNARPEPLSLSVASEGGSSIEEVLWRAFEVITPANHFVSTELMELVSKVESGQVSKHTALNIVQTMRAESFDDQQQGFLNAVGELIEQVTGRVDGAENA